MNKKNTELTIEQEVTRDCPILFRMRHRPMTETCMCWGFECDVGWHEAIASACREMEMLNSLFYPKYRVRIQADQIKEKFGLLHFYYSVTVDPSRLFMGMADFFGNIADYFSDFNRFDFKMKKIVDKEPEDVVSTYEISKEEYDEELKNPSATFKLEERDGKYYETRTYKSCTQFHFIPTQHKAIYRIKEFFRKISNFFRYADVRNNSQVRNCIEFMERKAAEIVRKAEDKCSKTCEVCGSQIGTEWSPAYMTKGWIKYICERCAKEYKGETVKLENEKTEK